MTMLLIPGFMADETLWDGVLDAFNPFGPVVHADLRHDNAIETMAGRALSGAPAGPLIVVGFSMGAYVARELVRIAPGRVNALVLIATSSRPESPALRRTKGALAHAEASVAFAGLSRAAVASSLHPRERGNDALIERVRAMGMRLGGDVFRRQSMVERPGDRDRLHEIRCPTLIVAAGHDGLRSVDEARELQAGIEGSTLTVIEDSGHMVPIEAPGQLADAITGWLAQVLP